MVSYDSEEHSLLCHPSAVMNTLSCVTLQQWSGSALAVVGQCMGSACGRSCVHVMALEGGLEEGDGVFFSVVNFQNQVSSCWFLQQ